MVNSTPPELDPELVLKERQVSKIDLEIRELSESRLRFYIGTVAVPVFVAACTLVIFIYSGFFDTHEKLIEIAKHEFQADTAKYSTRVRLIQESIVRLGSEKKTLSDSLTHLQLKLHYYDSLVRVLGNNIKGKNQVLLNLADQIILSQEKIRKAEDERRKASDSVQAWIAINRQSIESWSDKFQRHSSALDNYWRDQVATLNDLNARLEDSLRKCKR